MNTNYILIILNIIIMLIMTIIGSIIKSWINSIDIKLGELNKFCIGIIDRIAKLEGKIEKT